MVCVDMVEFDWDFDFKNIGQFYECFVRHESQNAVKQCLDFVDANALQLIADEDAFAELPTSLVTEMLARDTFCVREVDICKALSSWHQKPKNVNCDLRSLLKYVRWNLISREEFFRHVKPLQLVSEEDYFEFSLKEYPRRITPRKEVRKLIEDVGSPDSKRLKTSDTNGTSVPVITATVNADPSKQGWTYDGIRFVYICSTCGYECGTKGQIQRHVLFHGEPQFKCEECDMKYHAKDELKDHEKAHLVNFTCDRCGKDGFSRFRLITNHQKNCKPKK